MILKAQGVLMKKKLIVVCDEACEKYGVYLQQLVSASDDKEGEVVGTKDGAVEAVVWNEKQYEDNKLKLSSAQSILFMGNGKLASARRETMEEKYGEAGMHYGWLGSQAYLYVEDGSLNADNHNDFKRICDEHGKKFKKELNLRFNPSKMSEQTSDPKQLAKDAAVVAVAVTAPLPFLVAAGISDVVKGRVKAVAELATTVADKGSDILRAKEAQEQQYSLATLVFYMNHLSEFLDV